MMPWMSIQVDHVAVLGFSCIIMVDVMDDFQGDHVAVHASSWDAMDEYPWMHFH